MTRRARPCLAGGVLLILWSVMALPGGAAGADVPAGPSPWEESTPGLFESLPEKTVEALDNGIRGAFKLRPGEGVVLEKAGRWSIDNGSTLGLEISASAANASSKDYVPGKAAFPAAVTLVFGEDTVGRPFRSLLYDFFTGPWYGLFSSGIRLTYAWGHDAPVGSMYRLVEDETVFILAGPDEAGKTIASKRTVLKDFEAAYARGPKGPVTRLVVRVQRPSAEKGAASAGILLSFTAR